MTNLWGMTSLYGAAASINADMAIRWQKAEAIIQFLDERPVIVSFGVNGVGVNAYDCDDLFMSL